MECKIPNHLAIIMDGNGRWAKNRELNRSEGHLEGSNTLIDIAEYCFEKGIKNLSVFAFSTENFKRNKEEVDYLMNLAMKLLNKKLNRLKKQNIKVLFSGRKEGLPNNLIKAIKKCEEETKDNDSGILNICFNYGGRSEIVDAVKNIMDKNIDKDSINEDTFKNYLYNDLPDIDLLIRTSGEYRISNFMLYQMAYSELLFVDKYWPDFKNDDIDNAIKEFNTRERRFGK